MRAELWDGLLWMFAEEIGWGGGFEGGVIGYQGGRVGRLQWFWRNIHNIVAISSLRLQWFSNNIWV